jgi:hypothetical protein
LQSNLGMHVDRTRFLALTAAIAAVFGCNSGPPPSAPSAQSAAPEDSPPPPPASTTALDPVPPPPPSPEDPTVPEQAQAKSERECEALQPAKGVPCEPGEGFEEIRNACVRLKHAFLPRIADRAMSCLRAKSGTSAICTYAGVNDCASRAMQSAAVDTSSLAACRPIVDQCVGQPAPDHDGVTRVTLSSCRSALASVAPELRPRMLACMSEGCGVADCFNYVP